MFYFNLAPLFFFIFTILWNTYALNYTQLLSFLSFSHYPLSFFHAICLFLLLFNSISLNRGIVYKYYVSKKYCPYFSLLAKWKLRFRFLGQPLDTVCCISPSFNWMEVDWIIVAETGYWCKFGGNQGWRMVKLGIEKCFVVFFQIKVCFLTLFHPQTM